MKLVVQYLFACVLMLNALIVQTAIGQTLDPAPHYSFALTNQSPLSMLYGLPRYHETNVTEAGKSQWDISFDISNNFTASSTHNEFIRLDGENNRLGLRYLTGFENGWEFGAELALIHHGGGKLDTVVTNFHDLFGFGQFGRQFRANDLLNYQYIVNEIDMIDFNNSGTGIGDLSLLLAKQLHSSDNSQTSVRLQFKLPTGNSTNFFGSGGTDFNIGIHHAREITPKWSWQVYGNVAYLGTGDILPAQQKNSVLSAGAGLNWQAFERLSFRLQWDGHTAIYKESSLDQLRKDASLISIGGRISLKQYGYLDIAAVEDAPNPEASPDISFYINWRLPVSSR